MGSVIENEVWEPSPLSYFLVFVSCFVSIFASPYFASSPSTRAVASSPFDRGPTASFFRFRRSFFLFCSLASVIHGLNSFYVDYKYAFDGIGREQDAIYLSVGAASALVFGPLLGIFSDVMGPRKACSLFYILHFFVGFLRAVKLHHSLSMENFVLALATSLLPFCFESWLVIEHDKEGYLQYLSESLWMIAFFEAACLVGSQGLSNFLVNVSDIEILSPATLAALLAVPCIVYFLKGKSYSNQNSAIQAYRKAFFVNIFGDKRIFLLAWAQSSIHVSLCIFWILWAPTVVADGREVHLSRILPCFLGWKMFGSTVFPWFSSGSSSPSNEECLIIAFVVASLSLAVVAYDYQEIGTLVTLFCIFHACVGFILPSLARLRTMLVANELRGGVMSFSLVPANAVILFVFVQGGYLRKMENSTILCIASVWLLSAAGCIYALRRCRIHPRDNSHSL